MTTDEMCNILLNYDIATDEEIALVTGIYGYNEEVLTDILFYRTGYRSFETYIADLG